MPGTRYFARGVSENGALENVTTTANEEILRLIAEGEKAMAHGEWDVAINSCIAVMAPTRDICPSISCLEMYTWPRGMWTKLSASIKW